MVATDPTGDPTVGRFRWAPARLSQLRTGIDALFPTAPPGRVTGSGAALAAAAVVLGTVVGVWRVPGAGALDTVWAEDGSVFLTGAANQGLLDSITTSYAGYYHLLPRALAKLAVLSHRARPPAYWRSRRHC